MNYKKIGFISLILIISGVILTYIVNATNQKEVLQSLFLSIPLVFAYLILFVRFLSSTFFFNIFYLMLFYLQPVVYYITSGYYNAELKEVKILITLIVIGLHLFMIGSTLFTAKKKIYINIQIEYWKIRKVIKLTFLIAVSSIILLFVDAGTFNILGLDRLGLKNSGSIIRLIATFGLYLTSVLFFLIFFTANIRTKYNLFFWVLFVVLFEVLVFIFFRTRSLMVVHLSACIVGYYYSYAYYSAKYKVKSKKSIAFLFGVLITLLSIVTRFFRGYLQPDSNIDKFELNWKVFLERSVENGDLGYSGIVLNVIHLVPNTYDYLSGQSYYRLLFIIIPRSIWPEKPNNTETIVGGWVHPSIEGMSLPPGIIGDLYINFGIFGVIFMVGYGVFFSFLDRKVSTKNFIVWSVSATWIFHLVRGGFTNPIIIFTVLYIFIYTISKYYLKEEFIKKSNISNK